MCSSDLPAAALKDPNKKEDYNDLAEAAANYVNSSHAERYSNYFYINGRADIVRVVSDGVTDETMRKTDVEVEVLDHKTGQMKRGKLNVSLKVGPVKQFGQVGGTDYTSMSKLWGYFGINIEPLENHYRAAWQQNPSSALATLYEHISNFVNKELAGDDDKKEYDFIKHLAKAINYFATLEDPTVSLVQLKTKGKYVVLRFNALEPLLKQIDLESAYISNKTMPEIVIRDANTSKILITIRAKNEFKEDGSSYIRNLIEKGPLLEEVASVTK